MVGNTSLSADITATWPATRVVLSVMTLLLITFKSLLESLQLSPPNDVMLVRLRLSDLKDKSESSGLDFLDLAASLAA